MQNYSNLLISRKIAIRLISKNSGKMSENYLCSLGFKYINVTISYVQFIIWWLVCTPLIFHWKTTLHNFCKNSGTEQRTIFIAEGVTSVSKRAKFHILIYKVALYAMYPICGLFELINRRISFWVLLSGTFTYFMHDWAYYSSFLKYYEI